MFQQVIPAALKAVCKLFSLLGDSWIEYYRLLTPASRCLSGRKLLSDPRLLLSQCTFLSLSQHITTLPHPALISHFRIPYLFIPHLHLQRPPHPQLTTQQGDSPSDCAANFGITLSAGFQASNTVPAGTASATSATLLPTSAVPTITASASPAPTGTTPAFTGHAKNATGSAPPHATGTGAAPGGIVKFTGGAEVVRVGGIGAIIGGVMGFMLL